jgi:hypothetical protein
MSLRVFLIVILLLVAGAVSDARAADNTLYGYSGYSRGGASTSTPFHPSRR